MLSDLIYCSLFSLFPHTYTLGQLDLLYIYMKLLERLLCLGVLYIFLCPSRNYYIRVCENWDPTVMVLKEWSECASYLKDGVLAKKIMRLHIVQIYWHVIISRKKKWSNSFLLVQMYRLFLIVEEKIQFEKHCEFMYTH